MKILIAGGTGFLGKALTQRWLKSGEHQVVVLSRSNKKSTQKNLSYGQWDGKSISPELAGDIPFDVVINLSGVGIMDQRWTPEFKELVISSRVESARACVNFIQALKQKPRVFLAGTAIGYYGADRSDLVDETSKPGADFLSSVCLKWEEASTGAGIRTVFMRTGVVLGSDEGPFPLMVKPFKLFAGGPIGDGKQFIPWIHLEDWLSAVDFFIANEKMSGPVNISAPSLTDNNALSAAIAKALHRPNIFKVPRFALELLLGERAIIAWGSLQSRPKVLLEAGFVFLHTDIESTITELLT